MRNYTGLNPSKLHNHLVFHSESPAEARMHLAGILNEHDLTLGRGKVNTKLFERKLNDISVMKLTYGAEVSVDANPFRGFTLVQTPLSGAFEVNTGGCRKTFGPGDVAILTPQQSLEIHWQEGSEQIILKVPHYLTERRTLASGTSCNPSSKNQFSLPVFKLPAGLHPVWHSLVQQAIDLPDPRQGVSNIWVQHFEQTIALFLLTHQVDASAPSETARSELVSAGKGPAGLAPLERMEAYMQQRLCAPISLIDLANAAGLNPRSLNALCHKYHGVSPMVLLRNWRLDAVRRKLQSHPDANVTTIALDHGFGHLGRFSAYYRNRFGELPRDTVSRHFLPCM